MCYSPPQQKHQRVPQKPEGWAWSQVSAWLTGPPWQVWTPATQGASLAAVLAVPWLAVLPQAQGALSSGRGSCDGRMVW